MSYTACAMGIIDEVYAIEFTRWPKILRVLNWSMVMGDIAILFCLLFNDNALK